MRAETHRRDNGPYYRYCCHCGWGFTRTQWNRAAFCTRCGVGLKLSASPSQKQLTCFGCGREFSPGQWRSTAACPDCGRRFRRPRQATSGKRITTTHVVTPEVRSRCSHSSGLASQLPQQARNVLRIADRHPFVSATGTGIAGAGMIVGGQAISALGAGAATVGGVIAGMNMLGMFVATGTGARGLAALQFKGVGVGLGLMLVGTGVSLAGQAISLGGYVATGGAGLMAGYGVLKTARNRKLTIDQPAGEATLTPHVSRNGSHAIQRRAPQ